MSNIFQKLELAAFRNQITPRTKESREWFMKKAQTMRGINRDELMKEEPLQKGARRILGMNLHYLPPILRAQFLDALMDNVTSKNSEDAKFKITTRLLAGTSELEYYKPCIKHYLTAHVKSKFAEVKAPEWEIATFLPTAIFEKASKQKIYSDSRKKING